MSGGSLDYVYTKVLNAKDSNRESLSDDQREVVDDVASLLRSIEWSASGDYGPDDWRDELESFCDRWQNGERS